MMEELVDLTQVLQEQVAVEELVKKEALLLDIAKWWYLIRLGELGVYETLILQGVFSSLVPHLKVLSTKKINLG